MGATMLFGECLGKVVRLSAHDIAEIMEHQAATRRRFGEIALSWGLCRPQHVWQAWWDQLSLHTPHVDLTKLGIDAQAVLVADIQGQVTHGGYMSEEKLDLAIYRMLRNILE